MALGYAHVPDNAVEASLAQIGGELWRDWRPLLPVSVLPDEGLAEVVQDVLVRVWARRREIEAAGMGTA
jgi:hypothetical protein